MIQMVAIINLNLLLCWIYLHKIQSTNLILYLYGLLLLELKGLILIIIKLPTRHQLTTCGWNEALIGCALERVVLERGELKAKIPQYLLKRIGAITINKSQGETLSLVLAVKITHQYSPREKVQIVVVLSCTTTARITVIVREKQYDIQKI